VRKRVEQKQEEILSLLRPEARERGRRLAGSRDQCHPGGYDRRSNLCPCRPHHRRACLESDPIHRHPQDGSGRLLRQRTDPGGSREERLGPPDRSHRLGPPEGLRLRASPRRLPLAPDPIAVPIQPVQVRRQDPEPPIRDVPTVQVRRRRDADVQVGWIASLSRTHPTRDGVGVKPQALDPQGPRPWAHARHLNRTSVGLKRLKRS